MLYKNSSENNMLKDLNSRNDIENLFDRLFPICRSILGQGYRDSLAILEEYIPFEEICYETGRKVNNWTVPEEWVVRSGFVESLPDKRKVVDFDICNLHLMNYSMPADEILTLDELKKHLYVSSSDPSSIPYVFSYYKKRWGFAVTRDLYDSLPDTDYHVHIDTDFTHGKLVVGETFLNSTTGCNREILLSSYLCHPSMANNELSGPIVLAMLYQRIGRWQKRKYNYRFVINPETIGSISYLSDHGEQLKTTLFAGMVLTCLGGSTENLSWKESKRGNSPFDQLVYAKNYQKEGSYRIRAFEPSSGSDERQYCSAGYNLPVGQMSRMVYGTYKEYHTSNDTKELMGIENLIYSCDRIEELLLDLENDHFYTTPFPYGEVKLGDYNLYPDLNCGGNRYVEAMSSPDFVRTVMTLLSYADGIHSLSFVAMKLNLNFEFVKSVADILKEKRLIEEI